MSWLSSALGGRDVAEVVQRPIEIEHAGPAHRMFPTVQTCMHITTDASRDVKHFRCGARLSERVRNGWRTRGRGLLGTTVVASVLLAASACGENRPRENVQPPQPGVPARASDVQGIYRTIHQGVLQLRGNGSFVLIVPEGPGASAGDYSLLDGRLTVQTDNCGEAIGEYDVSVGGEPLPGKATLHFTVVRDDCEDRRHYLTIDPWVYANS
jgi:hypothetical protein